MSSLKAAKRSRIFPPPLCPCFSAITIALNLPAFLIVALVTILARLRHSGKRDAPTAIVVIIKIAVVVFFIAFGAFFVNPTNWHPFMPSGFRGVMSGAAIVFFAFIGFDAVSTTAEETKNPQRDMPIGMIASLIICTLLYVLMSGRAHRDEEIHDISGRFRGGRDRLCGETMGAGSGQCGRIRRT